MSDSGPPAFSATGSWVLPAPAQLLATLQHASGEVPCDVRAVRRLGLAVVVDAACEIRAGDWIEKAIGTFASTSSSWKPIRAGTRVSGADGGVWAGQGGAAGAGRSIGGVAGGVGGRGGGRQRDGGRGIGATVAQGLNVYEYLPRVLHSHFEYLDGCGT
ncbi:MAG TPA: hypothetical protein PLI95_21465 [Polyangiaceae bacterium]|nr:hypothetical protein [Polyangiaceae bacterium]